MKRLLARKIGMLFAFCALLSMPHAAAQTGEFSFGVIAHPFLVAPDESGLREAIMETDADNLAFVVANGIKSKTEPCSDALYQHRKSLLDSAKNGLIVSLSATDWAECRNRHGRPAAIERLNRIRELFFTDEFSLGGSRVPLVRESATTKFRAYSENARWEIGTIMFATINLPANNNHYLAEAGRNSEFEDRLIANRDWLRRLFLFARRKKLEGLVLFCDGDPLAEPGFLQRFDLTAKRDGFAETRKLLRELAGRFKGKVLVVHGAPANTPPRPAAIAWRGNLGNLEVAAKWAKINVAPGTPELFGLHNDVDEARAVR
ncbi:MAG TPA: hypothetical protein VEC06_06105 [Paucimonas sp.]|nr:hypothetical protein [Paucimonas sp.]